MISIVIPTLNEAHDLQSLLPSLAREHEPAEVTVVDGGSTDGSVESRIETLEAGGIKGGRDGLRHGLVISS